MIFIFKGLFIVELSLPTFPWPRSKGHRVNVVRRAGERDVNAQILVAAYWVIKIELGYGVLIYLNFP
jgi:hypothetical protein